MYTTSTNKQARKLKLRFEDCISQRPTFSHRFFAWATIAEVKKYLEAYVHTSSSNIRLFCKNIELSRNGQRLLDYQLSSRQTITIRMTEQLENSLGIINPYQIYEHSPAPIDGMLSEVKTGFLNDIRPRLTEHGTSGTYFLSNNFHKTVAIFKPFDQQPYTPNNPRGYVGELGSPGLRHGILSGESATREVAAYMLNDEFHGVPATTYVEFYHPSFVERGCCSSGPIRRAPSIPLLNRKKTKHGSLQLFAEHDDTVGDYSSTMFSVEQVHKIALLDLRILNCDRNEQNILVRKEVRQSQSGKPKKQYRLIPIDHGLAFPDCFEIYSHELIWMQYSQAKQPFTQKQLEFIERINPVEDCKRLSERLGFREICLRNFRLAETVLKRCAKEGLTAYQIGMIVYRCDPPESDEDSPMTERDGRLSELQRLVQQAENMYLFVKDNGIKATVEYQINLMGRCLRPHNSQNYKHVTNDDSDDEPALKLMRKQSSIIEKENKRSVSLPAKKPQLRKQHSLKRKSNDAHKEEQWEELFFHYFEEVLDRYLADLKRATTQQTIISP